MLICGLQKLSLLDYPEKLAATIFTGGCNLRCPFCHNASLVLRPGDGEVYGEQEILDFLKTRQGKLDGVCITGGEPLLQPDIDGFIREIRALGFLVKLDTNGSFPDPLKRLIDEKLLDYIAMDVKSSPEGYAEASGVPDLDVKPFLESIRLIMGSGAPYEFRTTVVKGIHDENTIYGIAKAISGADKYYLQSFVDSGDLVGFCNDCNTKDLSSFTGEELEGFRAIAQRYVKSVGIRA